MPQVLLIVEILSVLLVLCYMYFAAQRRPVAWICGIAASALSVYLFFRQQLVGSAVLNIIYALQGIMGYINWKTFIAGRKPAYRLQWPYHLLWIALCFVFSFALYRVLSATGFAEMVFIDLLLASGSIFATSLEIRKDTSCWWYWIICNTAYGVVYATQASKTGQSLYLYACLMIVLAVFSYFALRSWTQEK